MGRTDAEAETPILWPPDAKNRLIRKDPDAGKDWRREEKGMTEDEMVGWHHWLNGSEFEQAPGVGEVQGSLACCSPRGCKESDMTEWLKWTYGAGRNGEWLLWIPSFFLGWWKCSKVYRGMVAQLYECIKSYWIVLWWILCYVSYISAKWLYI